MTWEEMIQRRREKENSVVSPVDLQIACNAYLHEMEMALRRLSYLEQRAILLRFITSHSIARVADQMGMTWNGADQLIDEAVEKVRRIFLEKQTFYTGGAA